jgi:hypothetical protein
MDNSKSYVSWGAILAGSALAGAFSLVMLQFGAAVGLSASDMMPSDETVIITPARVFAIAFWVLWIQLLASMMGGYMAGRLRTPAAGVNAHEVETRDGAHGVMVWAVGTIVVFAAGALMAAIAALGPEVTEPLRSPEMIAHEKAISVISAFAVGATSLASAVASWWAATKGGEHRDNQVDFSHVFSFKR